MTETPKFNADAWANIITGLGRVGKDKRMGSRIETPAPSSLNWKEFEDIYFGDDIGRTVVDTPSQEMVKTWISIYADQKGGGSRPMMDPNVRMDFTDATKSTKAKKAKATQTIDNHIGNSMISSLEAIQAQTRVYESIVWGQVFGGSILFLGINDGNENDPRSMEKPLNEMNIKSFKFLSVFDRWDIDVYTWYKNPKHPKFGLPELYRIRQNQVVGGSDEMIHGTLVHETRVIRFDGSMVNRRRRILNAGWADSIYTRLAPVIRDFGTTWGGVANLMQDFAQAVFKMRGLAEALIQDKDNLVIKRIQIMDMARSIGRILPIDGESEEFSRTQTPVTGMPELLDRFAHRLAAAARMPVTLLMGDSPSGLNASGDSDVRWFFDHIRSRQEKELRPALNRLVYLLFLAKDGPTKGKVPGSWNFTFNPLWQMTESEMVKNRNTQAQTDQIYVNSGIVSKKEIAMSRFGSDRYSYETTIDPDLEREHVAKSADAAGGNSLDDKLHPSQKKGNEKTPKGDA